MDTLSAGYNPLVFKCPRTLAQSCCKLGRNASPGKEGQVMKLSNIKVPVTII